jgi:serine/threonine-protein kinase
MPDVKDRLSAALADRYSILRELGAGGMATVYLAEDRKHRRQVAVKVLRPELAAALGHERFLREIEIAAGLSHPHILPLYDSGDADGVLYYVMPYVEGESLRDRIDREKQLPLDEALALAREVADALSYAHARGVIHRDIKPENILLQSGHAVVADFGIARAVNAAGGSRLTETGLAVGTPAYMSPEQVAGETDLDGRSDLYALGCVLYETLAGQPPFTGPTLESVVHQHLAVEPRPITQLRPAVPAAVAGVLVRALAKNPADRFNPVAQFADALRPSLATTATGHGMGASRSAWRLSWLAGAALVVVAVTVGLWTLRGWEGTPSVGDGAPSVAVLPFADLSGGANEYLGDGMAETLINALSGVEGLRVAARTSAFSFKGRQEDVRAIGQALGVTAVLEGSVQRAGSRLRITAQLVNADDGFHLWSESFDRDVSDVFAVQDEVARAVVAALEVELVGDADGEVVELGTRNLAAYNAYLQGRFFWNRRTTRDIELSAQYFDDAIAADSGFARAWAGLASAYVLFVPSEYDVTSLAPGEALDRAEDAARRALRLDDRLSEAHTALAAILEKRGRIDEAGASFRQAIASDPRYPTARQWYGTYLAEIGRVDEGLEQMEIAAQLDPLSLVILTERAELLALAGRDADASLQYERVLELYPDAYLAHYFAGLHFLLQRDFDRAADLIGSSIARWGGDSAEAVRVAAAIRDPALRRATGFGIADTATRPEVAVAIFRTFGEDGAAVEALERAVDGPFFERIYVPHVLSVLGPELAADPRVRDAVARLTARERERYGGL